MKKFVGILLIVGIGLYLYSINNQIKGVNSICSLYKIGEKAENFSENARKYSIQYMGSYEIEEKPETMRAIFCAPFTMCDISCSLEYKNNKIIGHYLREY